MIHEVKQSETLSSQTNIIMKAINYKFRYERSWGRINITNWS